MKSLRVKTILTLVFCFCLNANAFAKEQKELRSQHFIIYHKNVAQSFLNKLQSRAEDYYSDIIQELGFRRSKFWTWGNRAKIYVFDSRQDYLNSTGMASWSGASVDYRNKVINTYPGSKDFFKNILVHELTHIIFREYVGFGSNVPLWLDEGVAMFMEKKKDEYALKRSLKRLDNAGSLFGFSQLSAIRDVMRFAPQQAGVFYTQSRSIVHFLIKRYGRNKFALFCYALKQGRSLEKSLSFAFGIRKLDELETKWQGYYF